MPASDATVELAEWTKKSLDALRKAVSDRDRELLCWESNGKVVLRDFQKNVVKEVEERFTHQDVVAVEVPCAGGKTILCASLSIPFLRAGKSIVFVSPKRDAFEHFHAEFKRVIQTHGLPDPGIAVRWSPDSCAFPFEDQAHIVSHYDIVSPNASRNERQAIDSALGKAGLVILDEVHRMPEDTAQDTKVIGKVEPIVREKAIAKGAKVLTMTGTHFRADNKSPFGIDEPHVRRTCQDLILEGCLPGIYGYPVPLSCDGLKSVTKRPNFLSLSHTKEGRQRYLGQVAKVILETVEIEAASCGSMVPGGHAIFVATQNDAKELCRMLNASLGSEAFVPYVSDSIPARERNDIQDRLRDGRLLGYATVMMGAESISITRLKYVHLVARITSPNKLMQAVGRAMRMPDLHDAGLLAVKDKAIIVDYQLRKKRILKLAMGLRDIARLGGSNVVVLPFGGRLFGMPKALPKNPTLELGEYEEWLTQTAKSEVDRKKSELLAMPKGCKRPKKDTVLGSALANYTLSGSLCYDPVFHGRIEEKQPHWFIYKGSSKRKKSELLAMPKGRKRPVTRKHPLGTVLLHYTDPKSDSYDADFDKAIRAKQPQWFMNMSKKKSRDNSAQKKAELLAMPKGCDRPVTRKHPLGTALLHYTSPKSRSYDADFDKAIRAKQPQWFRDTAMEKKDALLEMPKGCKRPIRRLPLGTALLRYTDPKSPCYDPVFDKAIRAKQPQWFKR